MENKYYACQRNEIIEMIPPEAAAILDIGCGYGEMGKRIKKDRGETVRVVGVELSAEAAHAASRVLDNVITGDIESVTLPYPDKYFDCIVFGDVLEHLIDPWKTVKDLAGYIRPGGWAVASIPNVSHYKIISGLLKSQWNYADAGILDRTHLRFFVRESILALFVNNGYSVDSIADVIRASKIKKIINRILFRKFQHLLTEQYIVRCRIDDR